MFTETGLVIARIWVLGVGDLVPMLIDTEVRLGRPESSRGGGNVCTNLEMCIHIYTYITHTHIHTYIHLFVSLYFTDFSVQVCGLKDKPRALHMTIAPFLWICLSLRNYILKADKIITFMLCVLPWFNIGKLFLKDYCVPLLPVLKGKGGWISVRLRLPWSKQWVPGQPKPCNRKIVSQ